jgi:hypothetical protein
MNVIFLPLIGRKPLSRKYFNVLLYATRKGFELVKCPGLFSDYWYAGNQYKKTKCSFPPAGKSKNGYFGKCSTKTIIDFLLILNSLYDLWHEREVFYFFKAGAIFVIPEVLVNT